MCFRHENVAREQPTSTALLVSLKQISHNPGDKLIAFVLTVKKRFQSGGL